MLTSFDHLTILVTDLDSAVACYQSLLGSAPTWRGDHPENATRSALFGLSNALVELVAPIADAPGAEGMRELLRTRGEGLYAIAFGTDDAEACSAALRASGVRATQPQDGEARNAQGELRRYRTIDLSLRTTRGLSVYVVERADAEALRASTKPVSEHADRVSALDHVVIRTADAEAAIALYEERLGIRLALDTRVGDKRMLFFRVGGVTLEVVEDHAFGANDVFYGATYRVRDLEAAHARMHAAGLSVTTMREGMKPATKVFSVKDGTCGVPTLILRDPGRDAP